jgi:putative redox protein
MRGERFTFTGHAGDALAARLDLPAGPPRAAALMAHCFTCGKDIGAARRIAARLVAEGFAVLRFDFTGLGHSGGEFANTTFTSNVEDLALAAAAMAARGLPPGLLIGHSLGGTAAIAAAGRIASVRAVAVLGAPVDPAHVLHHFGGDIARIRARIRAEGVAEVSLSGRPFRIGRDFVEDVAGARIEDALRHLKAALLVLHAPRDPVVGIENATAIFLAARHPKSFVTLDGADHLLGDPVEADHAAGVIAAWAARYVARAPLPEAPALPEGVTRVREVDPGGFLQDIMAGPHHLTADEPPSVGGGDLGPTPYQLLAAALGACTAMTLRLYARHKGIALDGVTVDVTHGRSHAGDAGAGGAVDVFARKITLAGDLDPATRARLIEIADRCPVHRTLERGARIETVALAPQGASA